MGRWYFSGAEEREWLKVAGGSKARLLEASWASWKGLFLSNNSYTNTDWWFGTFLIFPYIGNNHPNWLSYFSEGLKPPTRILLIWYYYEFLVRVSVIRSIILNIIYIYIRQMPGFCPDPQWRRATHHHHHHQHHDHQHNHHHHQHHQTLIDDLQWM